MPLETADRLAIHELIALHGHLADDREISRYGEVHTEDVVYDLEDFGLGTIEGLDDLCALSSRPAQEPVGHHVTNVRVTECAYGTVSARSKGILIMSDGRSNSVVYEDVVVKTPDGWRIKHRRVLARPRP